MTVGSQKPAYPTAFHSLQRDWGWFLGFGIAQIVLGMIAIGAAVFTTVVAVTIFGWLLLIGGAISVGQAFWEKKWGGFFIDLGVGILYLVAGFMIASNPAQAAITLTLMIALFLMASGVFRIVAALARRFEHSGWVLANGIITLILGILIWQQWPLAGLWVIGLFVGIEMILYGWSLVMLGTAGRTMRGADVPGAAAPG